MSKLKVLFEAGPMVDIKKTGVGYYVQHLITSLGKNYGKDIDLTGYYFDFLGRNRKRTPDIPNVSFIKIQYTPGKLLSLYRRFRLQPPLELFVRKEAGLIFHTNYVSLPSLRKRKTALAVYDLSFLDHPEYLGAVNLAYLRRFCPPSIRRADIIVTISEFTKERLLHHFPDLKAEIVITPIPPADGGNATELPPRLIDMGIVPRHFILYLGTVEPRKNLQNLVKAYALLPEKVRAEYSLVIAGGRGWKDEGILSEIKARQAEGCNIIQTGYISDEEKSALYSNGACFVLPSHYEGFGMPILEAMQYGLPAAVSDIPVFHEVAGKAAVYFDKDQPADIASKVAGLLRGPKLQRQLIAEASRQLTLFSWQKNTEAVYAAMNKVLAIKPRGHDE